MIQRQFEKAIIPFPKKFIVCRSGCTKSEIWAQVLSKNLSSTIPSLAARAQQQHCSSYILVPVKCYEYGSKRLLIFILLALKVGPSEGNHYIRI